MTAAKVITVRWLVRLERRFGRRWTVRAYMPLPKGRVFGEPRTFTALGDAIAYARTCCAQLYDEPLTRPRRIIRTTSPRNPR